MLLQTQFPSPFHSPTFPSSRFCLFVLHTLSLLSHHIPLFNIRVKGQQRCNVREQNLRMVKRSISEDDIKMALQPGWRKGGQLSIGLDNWTVLDAFLEDDNGNSYLKRSVECHKQRFREAKMRDTVTRVGREWQGGDG